MRSRGKFNTENLGRTRGFPPPFFFKKYQFAANIPDIHIYTYTDLEEQEKKENFKTEISVSSQSFLHTCYKSYYLWNMECEMSHGFVCRY